MDELIIFRDEAGKIKYNNKCSNCKKKCKQSHRTKIIACEKYKDRHCEQKG